MIIFYQSIMCNIIFQFIIFNAQLSLISVSNYLYKLVIIYNNIDFYSLNVHVLFI